MTGRAITRSTMPHRVALVVLTSCSLLTSLAAA